MCRLETISTEGVAAHRKVRFWNEAVSAAVATASADPLDTHTFSGKMKCLDLGTIRFAEILGGASSVKRGPCSARASYYILGLMLSGEITCWTEGTELKVRAGDLWLFTPTSRSEMYLPQPATLLSVIVQREHITRYLACPEALGSLVLSGDAGPGALASRYLRDFWDRAEHELTGDLARRFAEAALQIAASAYASVPNARPEGSLRLTQQRLRIRAYIEEHLRDPDLTPQSIAEELHITRGYMHRLFPGESESPARYILRRRLEEAHRVLSDRMQADRSITAIAFDQGFNSLPHFCRVFRAQYGITPRDLQRRSRPRVTSPKAPCSR